MTCRHSDPINNKECGSYRTPDEQLSLIRRDEERLRSRFKLDPQPDNSQFEIVDCLELSAGIVLKVKYESCVNCAYEGTKVLVYVGSTTRDIWKWRTIDPHFRDTIPAPGPREAPSPTARFPASQEGWDLAVKFLAGVNDR